MYLEFVVVVEGYVVYGGYYWYQCVFDCYVGGLEVGDYFFEVVEFVGLQQVQCIFQICVGGEWFVGLLDYYGFQFFFGQFDCVLYVVEYEVVDCVYFGFEREDVDVIVVQCLQVYVFVFLYCGVLVEFFVEDWIGEQLVGVDWV